MQNKENKVHHWRNWRAIRLCRSVIPFLALSFGLAISSGLEAGASKDSQFQALQVQALQIQGPQIQDPHIEAQIQRKLFSDAHRAIKLKRLTHYKEALRPKLVDYPLLPYLDYVLLKAQLNKLPYAKVDAFLQVNQSTALGNRLLNDWLRKLASKKHWHEYQSYYEPRLSSTTLKCYYLFAKLKHGEEDAFDSIPALWNVGKSQPKACDPVFDQWRKKGYLTPTLAWERHSKAIKARKRTLARFLDRHLNEEQKKLAALYREVDRYPKRILQYQRFQEQSPEMQEIILHGVNRLARSSPENAHKAWEVYDAQQLFSKVDRERNLDNLIVRLAQKGHLDRVESVLRQTREIKSTKLIELMLRETLRNQQWAQTYHWLQMLPREKQNSDRWRYWRARSIEQLAIDDPLFPSPEQIYGQLSLSRSFYGFLAADKVGHKYSLINQPVNPSPRQLEEVTNSPGIKRAKEFFALGYIKEARSEWFYSTRYLDENGIMATAKLAEDWGWYRKSIQAMIEIQHWDDLDLRFPLAFEEVVAGAAAATDIDPQLLFAIARQESAFSPDAKSPAGALGLMQLMPATARYTANKSGMRYRYHDLLKPAANITLGSRYLNTLLTQFEGNRILAAAAYNAGPTRVKQWLSASEGKIPFDIWIETIPYRETRGYVQNVLAFSVIYGHKLGQQAPMVKPLEAGRAL